MLKVKVVLNGVTPLLMNNGACIDDEISETGAQVKQIKTKTTKEDAKLNLVKKKLYKLPNGELYVPTVNFRAAYIQGSSSYKLGKGKFAPSLKNEMAGMIRAVEPEDCLMLYRDGKPITEYVVDKRRAVNPNTSSAVMNSRPRVDLPWSMNFFIYFDDTRVDAKAGHLEVFEDALKRTGAAVGMCDFRPGSPKNKTGWFGKFDVVTFEEVD